MTKVRNWLAVAMTLLLVVVLMHAAEAQPSESGRRGGGMMRGSFLGLVGLEQVQKELKLTEDQIARISEIGEKLPQATPQRASQVHARSSDRCQFSGQGTCELHATMGRESSTHRTVAT